MSYFYIYYEFLFLISEFPIYLKPIWYPNFLCPRLIELNVLSKISVETLVILLVLTYHRYYGVWPGGGKDGPWCPCLSEAWMPPRGKTSFLRKRHFPPSRSSFTSERLQTPKSAIMFFRFLEGGPLGSFYRGLYSQCGIVSS